MSDKTPECCCGKSNIPVSTKSGAKLVYNFPKEGTEKSRIKAERHLKLHGTYTVKEIWDEETKWYVTFLEVPGQYFNLQHFALAQKAYDLFDLYEVLNDIIDEHDAAVHNLECIAKEFKTQGSRLNKLRNELSRHVNEHKRR